MRTIVAFFAVITAGVALAQAYRWVDENGVVHYSDRPVEGAEQIVLPKSSPPSRPVATFARETADPDAGEPQEPFSYETIEVVSPAPEETLWNIEGVLSVALDIQPALRPTDQLRVYFDGEVRRVSGNNFQIQEVYRGAHNIQAEILDANGEIVGRSQPNRFYVQQNSIIRAN
jgi:hypothetical protein